MSTPVFCAVKETKGSLREELLTRGYVIAFFISHSKYKFRFCFSEEEVEAERKAARQMHERLGKYGYSNLGTFLKFPTCHTQASVAVPIALKSFLSFAI